MTATGDDRIRGLLAIGEDLLTAGRGRDAADAFGRILLDNPNDVAARQGLEKARVAAAEEARQLDAKIDEARGALDAGDRGKARRLLEDVVQRGGDRDRALALLERVAGPDGRLAPARQDDEDAAAATTAPVRSHPGWSRRAFLLGCTLVFALLAAGVAASWDLLVEELVRTPSPRARALEPAGSPSESTSAGQGGAR